MFESDLSWILASFLSMIMESVIVKFIFDKLSDQKYSKFDIRNPIIFIWFLAIILISTMLTILNLNQYIKIAIFFIMINFLYKYNYECIKLNGILICLFACLWIIFVDFISESALMLISQDQSFFKLKCYILDNSLLFIILPIINSMKFKFKSQLDKKEYIYTIIPIFSYIICVLGIFKVMDKGTLNRQAIFTLIIISIVIVVLSVYTFFIVSKIFNYKDKLSVSELVLERSRLINKYYLNLLDFKYQYNNDNEILNVILEDKSYICKLKNIELTLDLEPKDFKLMNKYDVCNLFSNIIDNSIYICELTKKRKIKIIGRKCGNSKRMYILKSELDGYVAGMKKKLYGLESKESLREKDTIFRNLYTTNLNNFLKYYNGSALVDTTKEKILLVLLMSNFYEDLYNNANNNKEENEL